MSEDLYATYNDAIGSLMLARSRYTAACDEQGVESEVAEQAREHVARAIQHRDEVRERYDAAGRGKAAG